MSKLGIVGAGSVGTSLAYAALLRQTASEMALFDIQPARVEAEVLDLVHGSPFAGPSRVTGASDPAVLAGADVVVVTAGAKQRPGQSRRELATVNARMLRTLMPTLVRHAPEAVYVIVTNPADVLTVVAQRHSGLPFSRIFSSGTVLDSARLRWELSLRTGAAPSSVHAMILGEHGDSQFPLWSQARVGPIPLRDWMPPGREPLGQSELDDIAASVSGAAGRVIAGKGATNYAIGLAALRVVEAVLGDERAILPVSSVLQGYRGITGVALSVPAVVGSWGIDRVLDVPMDPSEVALLHASADVVDDVVRSLHAEN